MRLVFEHDAAVAEWVARRIPYVDWFKDFTAIGIADGNRPVAGVVYNEFQPVYLTMQVSMAADTPIWAQRGIIRALLHYPFEQQGVRKLWAAIQQKNKRALKFNLGIGFTKEAVLAHHFGKDHAVICRMLDKDYRKRYGLSHGQIISQAPDSA